MFTYRMLTVVFSCLCFSAVAQTQCSWPMWQHFKNEFITEQGRVIDIGSEQNITTSEGQSYALFFSLIANDQESFDKLLKWTEQYLAEGDLSTRLPAWKWGKDKAGHYRILDSNPAADSDLWIAYTLSQAAKLWDKRYYELLSAVLAKRIIREEVNYLEGLGWILVPAPYGFEDEQSIRLNPSYSPLFIYHYFSTKYPDSYWPKIAQANEELINLITQSGAAPDWVNYSPEKGLYFNKKADDKGSYDAIRVYLWNALLAESVPIKQKITANLSPLINKINQLGYMPENIKTNSLSHQGAGPVGFQQAVLPMLREIKPDLAEQLSNQIHQGSFGSTEQRYYDSVLTLFAQGYIDKRYKIDQNGQLVTAWLEQKCP
ncbi:cellulose synthase complex periplasmic endoglucanase BcsZ [Catenovulum sp. 2E275]|uniref:cellulose synthase complex periplasmic endoglucanase BcsZ n=1 Tax=Catenovulum sp. 2E275 TaxID=2980497 RepID=UPI0021CF732B|nr:cellulose synthase complex periplasmic endoglucanase BcsZ [Catenovulum sp. 2E275]MCU4677045.1 cellulose synthase complex periplasmic endoglucanase BcsZ [Catenovulum sp. 2E275]